MSVGPFGDIAGVAVDVGGTKIAVARYAEGRQIDRMQIHTPADEDMCGLLASIEAMLGEVKYQPGEPLGFAMTGRIGGDGTWSAVNAGTLPNIQGAALGPALERRFGTLVSLRNDAASAALAEVRFGAGQGSRAFAYLTVSTGIGGGLVLDGQPLVSPDGLAGHIGFLSSPYSDRPCGSGRQRTVESVAGGRAIAAAVEELTGKELDARGVFEGWQRGDAWAAEIVDQAAAAIACLCSDLRLVFGLDRIALGGSIGFAPGFREAIVARIADEPDLFRVPVVSAHIGGDSALVGALTP